MSEDYVEPVNPVQIEAILRQLSNRIANGVRVCDERLRLSQEAERAFIEAYAHAYLSADGPQAEKRYRAELATMDERKARDVAEAAYKYAEKTARALEKELDAFRSIGVSTRTMYSLAGRTGEGA